MARYYAFTLSNGSVETMTLNEAAKSSDPRVLEKVEKILKQYEAPTVQLLRCNSHSRGDGFRPGYHEGLGMEVRSHEHFQRVLKERGLVELGREKQDGRAPELKSYIDEEIVREAIKSGAEISGREADALISGTYEASNGASDE